jgi:N-acyl-D-aspartate/D-glutamate deacylase
MAVIVREAVEAGALGFSTSRTMGHRAMDGRPVPGTFAAEDELFALGRGMAAIVAFLAIGFVGLAFVREERAVAV